MGKVAGSGDNPLRRDAVARDIDKSHGMTDHPGVGEVKELRDGAIRGNPATWDLADNLMDHIDG